MKEIHHHALTLNVYGFAILTEQTNESKARELCDLLIIGANGQLVSIPVPNLEDEALMKKIDPNSFIGIGPPNSKDLSKMSAEELKKY